MNPSDRFERQRDFVSENRLRSIAATVMGIGAIGRQVALQLAAMGIRELQLIDFDIVETSNITTQGYLQRDVGALKVEATRQGVLAIDPEITVHIVSDRFRPKQSLGVALFCCVDSIESRAAIWRSVREHCEFWVDGRMLGESLRILAAADSVSKKHYPTTLFPSAKAQVGRCTAQSTIYGASIAAGLMTHQFTRWLRGIAVDFDVTTNLLAGEMVSSDMCEPASSVNAIRRTK